MELFAKLFERVDQTTGTNEKIAALVEYFRTAPLEDRVWATLLLRGRVRRTPLTSLRLRQVFLRLSKAPAWLLEECYHHVGDTAETLALLMNAGLLTVEPQPIPRSLNEWMTEELVGLRALSDQELDARILGLWQTTRVEDWFLVNKLLTGAFRVGVSEKLVLKALAQISGDTESVWHQWLMGKTDRDFESLLKVFRGEVPARETLQAVPFCLASPVEDSFFTKEKPEDFFAEWKWDGIRAQLIKKGSRVWLWSRGEDMITESFPEIQQMAETWPDDVILDGELLLWGDDKPKDFNALQQRLNRKKLTVDILKNQGATFMAYDILHRDERDLADEPLVNRRQELETFVASHTHSRFRISQIVPFAGWPELQALQKTARDMGAEGFMLKNKNSAYLSGRKRGVWWKFKVKPYTLDAVLLYAQAGTGKRANLFTDYTFALWDQDKLVPFAKAYSGLDNAEIEELDRWIRRNTIEKFGPVRSLKLHHVFEIAFEGIGESKRHKSGIAVRFPRILRWRRDKKVADANLLEDARRLITSGTGLSHVEA